MSTLTSVSATNFESEVLKADGPVVVDFWAPWCMPCLRLASEIEAVSEEFGAQVKFVKVNIDTEKGLAEKFGVLCIPNLVLFKDGEMVDRLIGLSSRQLISGTLKPHLAA